MTPAERYEALALADPHAVQQLADDVLATDPAVQVVHGPEVVTAPVRVPVPDAGTSTAVLGHVALTRCTVLLDGVRGDGIRAGRAPEAALAAAVCDAEVERAGPLAGEVVRVCRRSEQRRRRAAADRAQVVAATRLSPEAS